MDPSGMNNGDFSMSFYVMDYIYTLAPFSCYCFASESSSHQY